MSTLTNTGAHILPDPLGRLRQVPWVALQGLGPTLEEPLRQVLAGAVRAERALDALLRAHRDFTADQRRVCAETLFGVPLWQRRVRAQSPLTAPTPLQMLAHLARDLGSASAAPEWLGVSLPAPQGEPTDWRDRWSIPEALATCLETQFGPAAEPIARALNVPGPITLRANRLRTTREALQTRLQTEGVETSLAPLASDALHVLTPRPNILALPSYREGWFEVQDEGSQLLVEFAQVKPGESVLDVCAGAGGKTLHLASLTGSTVHATDVNLERLERLRTRASRAGARVAIHGRSVSHDLRCDLVFVDAPCSEWGALRRSPDARWRTDPQLHDWPRTQLEILTAAAPRVSPSGRLVYATCTFRAEENQQVIDAFLTRHPEFSLVAPPLVAQVSSASSPFLSLNPHHHGTDGFFAAMLVRKAS